jgi:hypothetical protein
VLQFDTSVKKLLKVFFLNPMISHPMQTARAIAKLEEN